MKVSRWDLPQKFKELSDITLAWSTVTQVAKDSVDIINVTQPALSWCVCVRVGR